MKIQVYQYSEIGDRAENEDSCDVQKLTDTSGYAIVADGLGSHGGGAEASGLAVKVLSRYRVEDPMPDGEQIHKWMEEVNSEILRRRNGPWHMKTTAVALYFTGNRAIWAHTGDSRFYHFCNGELADRTEDQSVCQLYVMQGEITRAQIPDHPDKSRILHVLGEDEIKPVIHEPVTLAPGRHAFLLCSDGVWERLREEEIGFSLNTVQTENGQDQILTPEEWVRRLRIRAESRRHEDVDNNTAAAVFIEV